MSSADAEVYAALDRAFSRLGVRWFLFGAQAAILHGAARFTEDVDVTVELGDRPTALLVQTLGEEGLASRVTDDQFIEQTRVVPLVHVPTGTPVDVVLAGPGIEELFFEGVVRLPVEGLSVPVARVEDLVTMKILAGRPKDLEDVVALIASQGQRFDEKRVRYLISLLEQALDQRDLTPLLEQALERACRARPG